MHHALGMRLGLIIIASLILAPKLHGQTDPLAKWKPNVGDRFEYLVAIHTIAYDQMGSHDEGYSSESNETVIASEDTFYNGHSCILALEQGNPDFCWFHLSADTLSDHPLVIESSVFGTCDFTNASIDSLKLGSKEISVYQIQPGYSPDVRWFTYWTTTENNTTNEGGFTFGTVVNYYYQLSSADLGVTPNKAMNSTFFSVTSDQNFLQLILETQSLQTTVELIDPLSRPVRFWQFPPSDGSREISLNVADLPSGVYFLRISGEGMDEVKKVCIVH